jgi:hypothetical protein
MVKVSYEYVDSKYSYRYSVLTSPQTLKILSRIGVFSFPSAIYAAGKRKNNRNSARSAWEPFKKCEFPGPGFSSVQGNPA